MANSALTSDRTASGAAATRPLPCRPLGSTGWSSTRLTVGGVKWDSHLDEGDAVRLLERALDLGVNTFDTAAGYGEGRSETRLGLALEGRRDGVFLSTKTVERGRDAALRELDQSLERLRTDRVDLWFIHALDDSADLDRVLGPGSVLEAAREAREDGRVRFVGVSGHWFRSSMERLLDATPLDAVLVPCGLFNAAYNYSYLDTVVPRARELGMATLGMKVFGAGRVKHAASIIPYLRYSLHQPIDTLVIGFDSVAQLEEVVTVVGEEPSALPPGEAESLYAEALRVTQSWDPGEFDWVSHYRRRE